ncbi:MAG: hypothetical protein DRM98_05085 [Thermoplasmata archaeon]|nr:MAG: hypothetical protein DRM98_05085 [Thermoplasmata archaeon]
MMSIQCVKWLRIALVVIGSICLAGCSFLSSLTGETTQPTITPLLTVSPSLDTELPTQISPSPSRTSTPTPWPTHTPLPTLTAEERYVYVQERLATNGGCELPCWWGITPGESTWQEAKDQLPHRHFQFWFPEVPIHYDVHLNLTEEDGTVQSIKVQSYCFACDRFTEDWSRYSLDQVLSRYGVPSQVRIILALPVDAGGPIYYRLYVFYNDLGFGIIYEGPAVKQNGLLHTCFSFNYITLWLQSPESSIPLEHAINQDEWSLTVPLEEATGFTVEEFYEAFRHPDACLDALPTLQ